MPKHYDILLNAYKNIIEKNMNKLMKLFEQIEKMENIHLESIENKFIDLKIMCYVVLKRLHDHCQEITEEVVKENVIFEKEFEHTEIIKLIDDTTVENESFHKILNDFAIDLLFKDETKDTTLCTAITMTLYNMSQFSSLMSNVIDGKNPDDSDSDSDNDTQ